MKYSQVAHKFLTIFSAKLQNSALATNGLTFLMKASPNSSNSSFVVGHIASSPSEFPPNVVSSAMVKSDSFCRRNLSSGEMSSSSCSRIFFSSSSLFKRSRSAFISAILFFFGFGWTGSAGFFSSVFSSSSSSQLSWNLLSWHKEYRNGYPVWEFERGIIEKTRFR